jgi:hypothetical protein
VIDGGRGQQAGTGGNGERKEAVARAAEQNWGRGGEMPRYHFHLGLRRTEGVRSDARMSGLTYFGPKSVAKIDTRGQL